MTDPPNVATSSGEGSAPKWPSIAARTAAEDLPIALVWSCLHLGLVPGERLQDGVVGRLDPVRRERRPEGRQDAGLPVDERAVAVEGQDVELVEVEGGHGARWCHDGRNRDRAVTRRARTSG